MRCGTVCSSQTSKVSVPLFLLASKIGSDHAYKCLVETFNLPITFGVSGCGLGFANFQQPAQLLEDCTSVVRPLVTVQIQRTSKSAYNFI